jgi:SAM-dependent methyltransferase
MKAKSCLQPVIKCSYVPESNIKKDAEAVRTLDYDVELKILEKIIKRQAHPGSTLRILEAGCGREWYFNLNGISYEVTGVDLDARAMQYRKETGNLQHAIVGDLRTVAFPQASFDVIYCSFVLEHIQGAQKVLDNFVHWLAPDGLIIIRVPEVASVKSFLAKHLPRPCAILYYRSVWGIRKAGKPGFPPYPVFYDSVISAPDFHDYCRTRGLLITDELGVGSYASLGRGPFRYLLWATARLISLLTREKIHDRYVDRTFVLRKLAPEIGAGTF